MLEIGLHPLRAVDQKLHEGCSLLQQCSWCSAAIGAAQLRLEVPVEVFIRVALWRVGRQVEHLDLVLMRLHPGDHFFGMVCSEVVEYQEDFVAFAALYESLHEAEGRLGSRCAFEELEPHQSLAADGRDHRQAKALTGGRRHRRVSRWGITPHPVTVLCHRRLIGLVDDAAFLLGFLLGFLRDQGIDLLHPALHVPGLLLQSLTGGALRRVAPDLEVLTHRADRHIDAKLHLDQVVDGPSVPQSKRQGSCRGRLRGQDRAQHPFLGQRQGTARQVGTTGFARNQTNIAFSGIAEHGVGVQAYDPGDLAPRQSQVLAQAHGLAAQGLECIVGTLSSVDLVHGQ